MKKKQMYKYRTLDFLKFLSVEDRLKFINNLNNENKLFLLTYKGSDFNYVEFVWKRSFEKHDYWSRLYNKYQIERKY